MTAAVLRPHRAIGSQPLTARARRRADGKRDRQPAPLAYGLGASARVGGDAEVGASRRRWAGFVAREVLDLCGVCQEVAASLLGDASWLRIPVVAHPLQRLLHELVPGWSSDKYSVH